MILITINHDEGNNKLEREIFEMILDGLAENPMDEAVQISTSNDLIPCEVRFKLSEEAHAELTKSMLNGGQ